MFKPKNTESIFVHDIMFKILCLKSLSGGPSWVLIKQDKKVKFLRTLL